MQDVPFFAEHGQLSLRWIHLVAGVLWIGLLYFFNWVNGAFQATLDADTKRKVVPELMPRALFWFRWGAAWTWITGVLLMFLLYYMGAYMTTTGLRPTFGQWIVPFLGVLVGFPIYDLLFKTLGKTQHAAAVVIWGLIAVLFAWMIDEAMGFSSRAAYIHVGALFGTAMAANVWMRIWPAQRRIITAVKNGQAPDPADPAVAGLRSKHNTYMSVPLLLMMVSVDQGAMTAARPLIWVPVTLAIAFGATWLIYRKVGGVKGF